MSQTSESGCTADDLLKRAQQLGLPPRWEGLAALLTLALDRSGIPATLLDSTQTGPAAAPTVAVISSRGACPAPPAPSAPGRPPLRVEIEEVVA